MADTASKKLKMLPLGADRGFWVTFDTQRCGVSVDENEPGFGYCAYLFHRANVRRFCLLVRDLVGVCRGVSFEKRYHFCCGFRYFGDYRPEGQGFESLRAHH